MSELPSWRSPLARALHRNRSVPHLKFVQLATISPQGRPHNRTVVYRGCIDNSNALKFITDRRSEKIQDLEYQPWVEVCWYFTKTREQFRFTGIMQVVSGSPVSHEQSPSDQTLRVKTWQQLSDNAKHQFYWPNPGEARAPESAFSDIETSPLPPQNFIVLCLAVHVVDHLQLRGNPQERNRHILREDQRWDLTEINP